MNFTPAIEFNTASEIEQFQEERLCELMHYLSSNSPFYRQLFETHQVDIHQIKTIRDLSKLPFTTKHDLQVSNWDFLCVEKSDVAEYMSTSGTLGSPVTVALSANDLSRLAYNEAISFACAGATDKDIFQLMLTLDRQFMAGIAYYEGIRKLGASVVRVGPGIPQMQWETIEKVAPTYLIAVPSFILRLIEFAEANNINMKDSSVQTIVCIGEAIRDSTLELNALGKKIVEHWPVKLLSTYASTEMQTAFTECNHGNGGHLHPELILAEVLDDNDVPVKSGKLGELVITTLGIEAMPFLRYRTGDLVNAFTEPCSCGRNTMRIGPVIGRKQQMIKLKGTTLFPAAIFDIVQSFVGVEEYLVEADKDEYDLDVIRIYIQVNDGDVSIFKKNLSEIFRSRIRVIPELVFVSKSEMESKLATIQSRKVVRFLDKR